MKFILAVIIFLVLVNIFVWPIVPKMVEPFLVWLGVEAGFEEGEDILDILRSKFKEGAFIDELEQFFSVVGCERFDPTNDAHNTALNKLREDIDMNEVSPRNSEQFKILKEIYRKHEWDINSRITWDEVIPNVNRIECKKVEPKGQQNRNYYYHLKTEDGPYYIYQNSDDNLNDYIDKFSDHHDFKLTWEYVSGVEDRTLRIGIFDYNLIPVQDQPSIMRKEETGIYKDIIDTGTTQYGLHYIKTKGVFIERDFYYNIYLDKESEIKDYDARISEDTFLNLDSSGITWKHMVSEKYGQTNQEQFFIKDNIVWWHNWPDSWPGKEEGKYCITIGLTPQPYDSRRTLPGLCYESENTPIIFNEDFYVEPVESSVIVQYSPRSSDIDVATSISSEMPDSWSTNLKSTELWTDITSENPNDVIIVGGAWKNNLNRDKCGNKEGGSEEIYIGYFKEDTINIYCVAGNSAQDTIDSGNYLIMKYLQNDILPPDRELSFKTIRPEKWSVTDSSRYDIDGSGQVTSDGSRDINDVYNYIMGNEYDSCNPDDSLCPFTRIEFQEANGGKDRFNDNEIINIPYRMTN